MQMGNTVRLTEDIRAERQGLPLRPTEELRRERKVSPYERFFLELPVPIVLVLCWLAGVLLLVSLCASVLLLLWLLLGVAAGT